MEPHGINDLEMPNHSRLNGHSPSEDLSVSGAQASEHVIANHPVRHGLDTVDDVPALIAGMCLEELDEILSYLDLTRPDVALRVQRIKRMITLSKLAAKHHNLKTVKIFPEASDFSAGLANKIFKMVNENTERLDNIAKVAKDSDYYSKLARDIIRQRQKRSRYFDITLFADPAWDMMLDLFAAHSENRNVSVTSLCIASGVPPTTALRWIGQMVEVGLFQRVEDQLDRRRAFIMLTTKCVHALQEYFSSIEISSLSVI